jgi:Tfp pilus assembly protein PilX
MKDQKEASSSKWVLFSVFRKGEMDLKNEDGTVLIVALLMLILLTVVGISASTISSIDIQIAGNEKLYKTVFYAADGGTEAGSELLEKNIDTRAFTTTTIGNATIYNNDFWAQTAMPASNDAIIPITNPTGNIGLMIWGNSALSTGGAIQLVAGYEGKGKGASGSGAYLVHDIRSEATTQAAAKATVRARWRHMI